MIASLPGMDYSFEFSAYGFPTHTLANPGTGGLIQVSDPYIRQMDYSSNPGGGVD